MKSNSRLFALLFIALAMFCLAKAARAQPGSGGPQPGAPSAVPLDGGVSLLLAAGAGLGLRRLRRRPGRATGGNVRRTQP